MINDTDWVALNRSMGGDDEEEELEVQPAINPNPSNITQHTLLSYLLANFDAWARVEPIIKPEFFDEEYKRAVQYMFDHTEQYKQIPSTAMVRMKTGVLLDLYGPETCDERTTDWLLDEIQTFCRHRATEIEILRAAQAIQKDSSRETLEQIFQNFKAITEISLEKDLGIEVHRDAKTVFDAKEEEEIMPTKYVHFDRATGGGLPCPGVVLFAGSSGLGKSVMLANMGIQYCQQGHFVVYISLELGQNRIFQRVSAMMTEVPIRSVRHERDRVTGLLEHRIVQGDGLFRIKKMGMSGTTTTNINAYLKELWMKEGVKPKVLVLDYLDLLHPRTRLRDLGNIHIRDKYAAEETYSLCEEWNMLCISASQMVKNNSELDLFDHASISGGTPKINTVDYLLALKRQEDELIARIMKGRYGGEGTQLPFHWNIDTLRVTDRSEEEFYKLNPLKNPNFKRDDAQKTAAAMSGAINKDNRHANRDTRAVQEDLLIAKIGQMSDRIIHGEAGDIDEFATTE